MKYKKGNPITCINDLVGCIKRDEYIFLLEVNIKALFFCDYTIASIIMQIENRNFYYAIAIEDTE